MNGGAAAKRWRASNPRRVGLHEVVRGLGGRNAPDVDGCRESEISLRVGRPAIRPGGGIRLDAGSRHRREGCNGRAPASPLPRCVVLARVRDEAGQR